MNGLGELNTTPNVSAIANVHPDKVKLNRLFISSLLMSWFYVSNFESWRK